MNKKKTNEKEALHIIGFKIFSNSKKVDFFTIIIYGENDKAITKENSILFFNKLEIAPKIVEDNFSKNKKLVLSSSKASLVCNIKEALRLIENEDFDDASIIVNSLNITFDLLNSVKISFPSQYKEILFLLADHLTFDRSISDFFEQKPFSRALAIDGFLWCIGAILSRSILVSSRLG